MTIRKIDNGALKTIKLEGLVNKTDRYMAYNNILFTEDRENPMLVINEAETGGFIVCKVQDKKYVLDLIKKNFKYLGYSLIECEGGSVDSKNNIKINYEIKSLDSMGDDLLNTQGNRVYKHGNDDFHVFENVNNDNNFVLVTALSKADKMRYNKDTKRFQTLVIYDKDRTGGILFTEHTRNGVVKARLREIAEYYGMEVKIEANNEYIFSCEQTAVIRFKFIKPTVVLDLGM